MCHHLQRLEEDLLKAGCKETYRGQAWSDNCREWVYFDCILDTDMLLEQYDFPDCIRLHENTDSRSGMELGFVCTQCNDAIMGGHPKSTIKAPIFKGLD
ncbi:MAG: hypothetical protein AAFP76_10810 [Bacteroidota bacterium]